MKCTYCGKEVLHRKEPKSKNSFCNNSCAAKYNNVGRHSKYKKYHTCKNCGKSTHRKSRCLECFTATRTSEVIKKYTVGEIKQLYKDKTSLNIAAKIRGYGKTIYERSNKPKHCVVCGYNKHYEICHIKSVASFDDNATMLEVHSLDNMIALCPNCHWEFDKGLLNLKSFRNMSEDSINFIFHNANLQGLVSSSGSQHSIFDMEKALKQMS